MAVRSRIQRRRPAEEEDDDIEEEPIRKSRKVVEMEPEDEDYVDEDDDDDVDEDDDEPVVKSKKPAPKVAPKAAPKVAPKAAPKAAPKVAPKRQVVVEDDDDDEPVKAAPKVKSASTAVVDSLLPALLESLETGGAIMITKIGDNKWQVSTAANVVAKRGNAMSKKEYWDTVLSPEFVKWHEEWDELTFAERKAKATKAGAKWEAHSNPKIEMMRITDAYRNVMGIEKYKPEYASRSARAALQAG